MGCLFQMLDNNDLKVIDCLKHNGRWSVQKISKETKIPITTVHNRLKKLTKEGVIKNYTISLDYKKIGKPVSAYILITVDYHGLKGQDISQYDLAKKLLKINKVDNAAMVTGGVDIILKVRVKDIEELNDFVTVDLRNMQGIEKTQTMLILNEAEG